MLPKFPSNHIPDPSRDIFALVLIIQSTFYRWWSFIPASVVSAHEIFLILPRSTCSNQCLICFQSFLLQFQIPYLCPHHCVLSGYFKWLWKQHSPYQGPLPSYLRLGGYMPLPWIIIRKITFTCALPFTKCLYIIILFVLYNISVTYKLLSPPMLWMINLQHRDI